MDTHKNARLTPKGREEMVRAVVDHGMSKAAAARRFNTTSKTVAKWVDRFSAEGVDGLRDRSSRPLSSPDQTPPATCAVVEVLRRQRHTQAQIAAQVGISTSTVSRIVNRCGLGLLSALEPHNRAHDTSAPRPVRSSISTSKSSGVSMRSAIASPATAKDKATAAAMQTIYSITSSARTSSDGGTVRLRPGASHCQWAWCRPWSRSPASRCLAAKEYRSRCRR